MSEFRVNSVTNQDGSAGPQVCGISPFSGKSGVQIPAGSSNFRRHDGGGRGRGVFGSGATPSGTNVMDLIEIATTGNSTDFGNDIGAREENYASFSSTTRGVFAGGKEPAPNHTKDISFFTFSSQGGVNDFGDLITAVSSQGGCGNNVRGLSGGGRTPDNDSAPGTNNIEFVTIASTGDGTNFGDLTQGRTYLGSGIASPTRGVWHGGNETSPTVSNIIDFVTIATFGDAVDFGDVSKRNSQTGCSNSTRGLIAAGQNPSNLNSIEFITIASTGNAQDFGDVYDEVDYLGSCANATRGIFAGGQSPTKLNTIGFVTISTTGNTTDFGDLTVARRFLAGCSDVHGGLTQ